MISYILAKNEKGTKVLRSPAEYRSESYGYTGGKSQHRNNKNKRQVPKIFDEKKELVDRICFLICG